MKNFSPYLICCLLVAFFYNSGCVMGVQDITGKLELLNPGCDLRSGTYDRKIFNTSFQETWKAVNAVVLDMGETIKKKNEVARTIETEITTISKLAGLSQEMNPMEYSLYIRVEESFDQKNNCNVILTVSLLDKQQIYVEDLVSEQPATSQFNRIQDVKRAIGRLFFCKMDQFFTVERMPSECRIHIVKSGDSLSEISSKYYGTIVYWRQLAEYNKLRSPYEIIAGDTLQIPDITVVDSVKIKHHKSPVVHPPSPIPDPVVVEPIPPEPEPVFPTEPAIEIIKDTRELYFTSSYNNTIDTTKKALIRALNILGVGVSGIANNSIRSLVIKKPDYQYHYTIRFSVRGTVTTINLDCSVEAVAGYKINDQTEQEINQFTFNRLFPAIDHAIVQMSSDAVD
jgi:LysM repeat protein